MQPEQLDELLEKLELISNLDGVVSTDERHLIKIVKSNVDKFKRAYQEALEDNVITNEEREKLRTLWKSIMIESSKAAIEDQNYSKDELALIFHIFSSLIKNLE